MGSAPRCFAALALYLCVAGPVADDARTRTPTADLLAINPGHLDRMIRRAIHEGGIHGVGVGIVAGDRLVYQRAFGELNDEHDSVRPDSLFQIASVTKTFTATLLCALRDDGKVALDDPVGRYLQGVELPSDPAGAPAITLRHLATHTSGLPANPINRRDLPSSPSVMLPYSVEELYDGLAQTPLEAPVGQAVRYSNLGYGLLGHALERTAGMDFESLLLERIIEPLGLRDTRITLSAEDEQRLAAHYWPGSPDLAQARWRFGEISGFGGLTSSVPDLARWVAFQLGALELERSPVMPATLRELRTPQRITDSGWLRAMALAWHVEPTEDQGELVYHGGELDGHSSFVGFLPAHGAGVIVLANQGGNAATLIGMSLVKEVLAAVRAELDTVASRMDEKRWPEALPLLRTFVERNPRDGRAAFRLGTVLLELDRTDEARAAFETAGALGYDRPGSTFNRARCHARAGDRAIALNLIEQAVRLGFRGGQPGLTASEFDPLHREPRFRALVLEQFPEVGDWYFAILERGAKAVLPELSRQPPSERAVNTLGYQLLFRDRWVDAIEIFRFNVSTYPRSWNVYDSLGEAYMTAGRTQLAIHNYRRSIKLNPGNANGRQMLERLGASAASEGATP